MVLYRAAVSTCCLEDPARGALRKAHPFRWAWIAYAAAGVICSPAFGPSLCCGVDPRRDWPSVSDRRFCRSGNHRRSRACHEHVPICRLGGVWHRFLCAGLRGDFPEQVFSTCAVPWQSSHSSWRTLRRCRSIARLIRLFPFCGTILAHHPRAHHHLSYAAFALALGLGHIALLKVIRGKSPEHPLSNYLYRTSSRRLASGHWNNSRRRVANLLLGKVLDRDARKPGVVALLGSLIVLHGRVAGKWAALVWLSVPCSPCKVFIAWYGVNFVLGVGLHSYGCGTAVTFWALLFVAAEVTFVLLATLRRTRLARRSFDCRGDFRAAIRLVTRAVRRRLAVILRTAAFRFPLVRTWQER